MHTVPLQGTLLDLPPYPCPNTAQGDWDFTGEDTQYLTHALHPYLASMIPPIPRKLLGLYAGADTRVLDPFVGGGAVLLEASLAGLPATGVDINPLAVLISRAKTTPIPSEVLRNTLGRFGRTFAKAEAMVPDFPDNAKIDFWFKPYMLEPLAQLRRTIDLLIEQAPAENRSDLWTLLACIYSNTVRDVSLTYRGEVRLRRLQGNDLERFNPDVLREFNTRMEAAFHRVQQLPARMTPCRVIEGDVRKALTEGEEFDLVITSPPYGDNKNTIPYNQFSKNMLYWLGIAERGLAQMKDAALGAKNGQVHHPTSPTLHRTLEQMQKANLIHEAVCFYADYYDALARIAQVTRQRIVIVIGHRILDAVVVDNATITTEIMKEIGWDLEVTFERRIRKKRINRKMGFGNGATGGTIDSESILVYQRR